MDANNHFRSRPGRAASSSGGRRGGKDAARGQAVPPSANDASVRSDDAADVSRMLVAAVDDAASGALENALRAAFRERIGADRYDVWFAGTLGVRVHPAPGGVGIVLEAGSAFTHDWLQRTFRADFAAAAEQVCGRRALAIEWSPRGDASAADGGQAEAPVVPRAPAPLVTAAIVPTAREGKSGGVAPRNRPAVEVRDVVAVPMPASRPPAAARIPLSLEQYVVGVGNRMAHAAAMLAADQPGAMSPLVIHGPGGTGKTHLLEGIGRRMRERHPRAAVVMLSAEQFTTTFLETLHGRRGLPGFRRSLRTSDLLIIDDIQFLIGKKATISELLHTLDDLHRAGRQVVFGADRDVESLAELGPEFQARLRGGMSARLMPPDESTRAGIVESLAARRGLLLPGDVVGFVAARMTRNTRELAGAVNRLEATSHMLGLPVTLGMAEECLADLVRSSTRAVRLADVERAVCAAFGVDPGTLQSSCRARRVNQPRMLAMFLARKHTPAALAEIGTYFGRRSHSTVIAAQRAVDGWIAAGSRVTLADAEWGIEEAIRRVEEVLRAG